MKELKEADIKELDKLIIIKSISKADTTIKTIRSTVGYVIKYLGEEAYMKGEEMEKIIKRLGESKQKVENDGLDNLLKSRL